MATIAYSSPFVPPEWIAAHGHRPTRVHPDGEGGDAPAGVCPFAEAFRRSTQELCLPTVYTTTCDQMRRTSEAAEGDHFLLNVPHTTGAPAHRLYTDELRRLGRFLVHLGGREPTRDELATAMIGHDDARRRLRAARGVLSGREWTAAATALHESGDPDCRWPESNDAPIRSVPIALLGVPLRRGDRAIFRTIEEAGGDVVLDGTEHGERGLPRPFDRRAIRDDPLLELSDAYFGTLPDAFRRPNRRLYEWLAEEIPARGIRGMVLLRCPWCDLWRAELPRLKEWLSIPVVDLDLAGDRGQGARAETRIQALMDMIAP